VADVLPLLAGDLDVDLRAALVRGADGLVLGFQPQVEVASGRLVGLEALVSWEHPARGCLEAADFLTAERDQTLVAAVGEHVLVRAISQLAAWRTLPGYSRLHLAARVTAAQLRGPRRVSEVVTLLDAVGLPPRSLVLGVREDVVLDAEATGALLAFAAAGVRVCLDDFGTGACSLHHLRVLPVSMVKVHRTFVAGLGSRARDEAIVRAVAALASDLGALCVAEGAEHERQRDWLRAHAVPLAQGPLLHARLAAPAVTALLRHQG
jgi:EAL domain-containing protein (putative c-di-GMP-specific phosphodiesterase class I)